MNELCLISIGPSPVSCSTVVSSSCPPCTLWRRTTRGIQTFLGDYPRPRSFSLPPSLLSLSLCCAQIGRPQLSTRRERDRESQSSSWAKILKGGRATAFLARPPHTRDNNSSRGERPELAELTSWTKIYSAFLPILTAIKCTYVYTHTYV